MAAEKRLSRPQLIAAYVVFSVFALVLCLYLTFPYDAIRQRAELAASAEGMNLTIGAIGPGFFGITAKRIRLGKVLTAEAQRVANETGTPESTPLEIESVAMRPALFPPGVSFRVKALGGTISGSVGKLASISVKVSADDVDFSKGNLKGFSGLDLSGTGDGSLSLSIPNATVGKSSAPDLGQATGALELNLGGLTVNGGTLTVPMYGTPTPMPLPKIQLGDLDAKVRFEKGLGTVERLAGRSSDLEIGGEGTLKLAKRLPYSEPQLELRLKADPDFLKRLGLIGSAFSMIPAGKEPGWRALKMRGFLGRPDFPDFRMR
ncbi:MAG: type II secretion system protein GspN [Myxococcaceae bacterium]